MNVINKQTRNRVIRYFITAHLISLLLICLLFFFQFVLIPRVYHKQMVLTNDKVEELLKYTNETDSLIVQIQKAPELKGKVLVPFYNWTDDLNSSFKQPFYNTIINSYVDLVDDISQTKAKDTTLVSLKKTTVTIQRKNIRLIQENEALRLRLAN